MRLPRDLRDGRLCRMNFMLYVLPGNRRVVPLLYVSHAGKRMKNPQIYKTLWHFNGSSHTFSHAITRFSNPLAKYNLCRN